MAAMSQPVVFITQHTVKAGKLAALERLNAEFVDFVAAHEPRTLALQAYLDDTRTRLTLVQIHPDADSLDFHLEVAGEKIHAAFDVVDNDAVELYGMPGRLAGGLLEQLASAGIDVRVRASSLGGFARLAA
jgi:hypothetical protein